MTTSEIRTLIQNRFIHRPFGYLLDCAKPDGSAMIPTPEECQHAIPNVLGWGVANENGAFFTGLYLYALCQAYDTHPQEDLKQELLSLRDGLFLLCDVCRRDGCIARGVSEDGVSHYPFSSEDQVGPFVLGLWRLSVSKAADQDCKKQIEARLRRTISGLHRAGWRIPTEWEGVTRGSYGNADWRGVPHLLFCAKVGEQLGLWDYKEYEALRNECPQGSAFSRHEILSQGFAPEMLRFPGLIQFWIHITANLCTFELMRLDREFATDYRKGLESNGYAALRFLEDYRCYRPTVDYNYDWRMLNRYAKEWKDPDEAVTLAGEMLDAYTRTNPRWYTEHKQVGQMLFGAWIAAASPNRKVRRIVAEQLEKATEFIDFHDFCLSYAFTLVGIRSLLEEDPYKDFPKES